ncbi:hypothetical protein [Paracoccus simplex]|uniref:hypothetical protein n=1 Tax=Paracoccus simplex TaxID=2086346 RepID=UPI00366E45C4
MSIVPDTSFIPRVEQKVNLPVAVTGRAVQHIQKGGDRAVIADESVADALRTS